jgi:AmmeMemoRadiSam system protein B
MDKLPALRGDIQLVPGIVQGRQVVAVQDRLGLSSHKGVLSAEILTLLPLFDGTHSPRDLQVALMRQQGNRLVMQSEVEHLIQQLDELYLLQTERYHEQKDLLRRQFAALPNRPASLAGSAYPADGEALRIMMQQLFTGAPEGDILRDPVRAIVAPHIDLSAGQEIYVKAYAAIRDVSPSRALILGTGHGIEAGFFSLTTKDYETPLGRLSTDRHAAQELRQAGGTAVEPDDFAHRLEHSVEFQLLFLQHLIAQPFEVIPILVGSFGERLAHVTRPRDIPDVARFLDALGHYVNEETLIVAGVDFSHVGPKFGHPHAASSYESEFREHDGRLLEALCRGSIAEFWAEGQRVEDRYHVCGFSALACLLEVLPNAQGTVLGYDVRYEAPTRSAVSFAAVALT